MAAAEGVLSHLATPTEAPWTDRVHDSAKDGDPRAPFERDRDRILYSESFRRLAHKTQVFIVTESDLFCTRILHSLEAAQIGRSMCSTLGLTPELAEAICLGHDVGHTPFGHIGEKTLEALLATVDVEWNSNEHSLRVLDELEMQYPGFRGLDLTWATREGIGRHQTPFDAPGAGMLKEKGLDMYKAPSLECQVSDVADQISYVAHDVHDALRYGVVTTDDFDELGLSLWRSVWTLTQGEYDVAHPEGKWPGVDLSVVKYRRLHRHLIGELVSDAVEESARRGSDVDSLENARDLDTRVIAFSDEVQRQLDALLKGFLYDRVYKSPLVARQNAKARRMLNCLFKCLMSDDLLLPRHVRERIDGSPLDAETAKTVETAHFLAELSDRGAIDLYKELYAPDDRAMGHHVS